MTVFTEMVGETVVKSRARVKSHGEVFTPRHMVDRMLDLVSEELESCQDFVDKTFLEPSAGDGNFLVAILQRKLAAVRSQYPTDQWGTESLFALASIYGIEILEDNHEEASAAMLATFAGFHESNGVSCGPSMDLYRAAVHLIKTNLVRGNTLTGQTPDGQDIQFSWWHRMDGQPGMVQREAFTLNSLRETAFLDFNVFDSFSACPIEKVHEEARVDE